MSDDQNKDEEYFRFLDQLRETGMINMFGAHPVLAETFGISQKEAKAVWVRWAKSFEERHPRG